MRFLTSLVLLAALVVGCKSSTDPTTDNSGSGPTEITLTQQTDLPQTGGSVSAFATAPSGAVIAIIDGRLFTIDAAGNSLTQIGTDTTHLSMAFAANGDLYTVMQNTLRKYNVASGSYVVVTLPITTNATAQVIGTSNGDVFVVNSDGFNRSSIYRSSDNGASWTKVVAPDLAYKCHLALAHNGDLLCASASGVFRSHDQAATWTTMTNSGLNFVEVRVFEALNGDVFYWAPLTNQLMVSHAGGSFISIPISAGMPYLVDFAEGSGGDLYVSAVDVQVGQILVPSGILRSSDGGNTFSLFGSCIAGPIVVNGSTTIVGTTNGGGILVMTDGATWRTVGRSTVPEIRDFAYDKDGKLIISAARAVYRQTASGWQTLGEYDGAPSIVTNKNGAIVLAGVASGMARSSDNGLTWTYSKLPQFVSQQWGSSITALFARTNGEMILSQVQYNTNTNTWVNGLLSKSADNGASFTTLTNGTNFIKMTEDPTTGYLYGHTENFTDDLRSTDGGNTWATYTPTVSSMGFTNTGKSISTTSLGFKLTKTDVLDWKEYSVKGATSGYFPIRIYFSADDRMHILTTQPIDGTRRLYVSSEAIR